MACAARVCECAYLAGVLSCLPYLREHAVLMHAPASELGAGSALPTFDALRAAAAALAAASARPVDLATLLSASPPPAQRALAEGMWTRVCASVRGEQLDDVGRARVLSAGGAYAGSWLEVLPVCVARRAVPSQYRLALAMRLGLELPEVERVPVVDRYCVCGEVHDARGCHPSVCGRGNRASLWTTRHDAVQHALVTVARAVGRTVHLVGAGSWFSSAALAAAGRGPGTGRSGRGGLRADIVLPHYRAPCRHLYIDVAVTTPDSLTALRASPSSRDQAGVAAEMRVSKKRSKYGPAVAASGAGFRAAVLERFGACSDDLVGLVRELVGQGDRDPSEEDRGWAPGPRVTYHMQRVVFAAVLADAEMVERALDIDVHAMCAAAVQAAAAPRGGRRAAGAGG